MIKRTLLLLVVLSSLHANARYATPQDAPIEVIFDNYDIVIDDEAKYTNTNESQIRILNENGRTRGTTSLTYDSVSSNLQVIAAKTIYQGKEYIVPASSIEIKPLASDNAGFDQLNQVIISYPHAQIGAELYLKTKETVIKTSAPKLFTRLISFYGTYTKSTKFNLKSKIKLNITPNDPNNRLTISETSNETYKTILSVTNKEPICEEIANENHSVIPYEKLTWVLVTTAEDAKGYLNSFSKGFVEVISQKLPNIFEKIQSDAKNIENEVDQINFVTSQLSEKMRYMGDWRPVDGSYKPRALKLVAEKLTGDCKDFSSVTAAILNGLGYKTNAAFVYRGAGFLPPKNELLAAITTNHVIIRAISPQGRLFWIDPTNFISMADGIFPDIADRPAGVLSLDDSVMEKVPAINYKSNISVSERSEQISNDATSRIEGKVTWNGIFASKLTGSFLVSSEQTVKESLINIASDGIKPIAYEMQLPALTSRIVKPISATYWLEQENDLLLTNSGKGILLNNNWNTQYLDVSDEQVGDIYIGEPYTMHKVFIIKNAKVKNLEKLNHKFESKWLNLSRECTVNDKDTVITTKRESTKSFISADEIKSPEYKNLKSVLKKYYDSTAIILE